MNRDRIDQHIDEAARRLRTPPDVPHERIWERIEAARHPVRPQTEPTTPEASPPGPRSRPRTMRPWLWWPAAAAALLVLGFGLGRMDWSAGPAGDVARIPPAATGPANPTATAEAVPAAVAGGEAAWTTATTSMFLRAEALLAAFDAKGTATPIADPVPHWASLLLYETRVLMDAPAADDPELLSLLADLELVLAQIAQLRVDDDATPAPPADETPLDETYQWAGMRSVESDRAWIADGLVKRATLQRLRQHTQAGAARNSL